MRTGGSAVLPGHVGGVGQEGLGEHAGDSGLQLVGRSVEGAAHLGQEPAGEVPEGPVVVLLRPVAQLLADHAAGDRLDQLVQL